MFPIPICGANAVVEKTMQSTKHILHMFCETSVINFSTWLASGVELRSCVDGRHLPEQLRARVRCRWRVTPSLSF